MAGAGQSSKEPDNYRVCIPSKFEELRYFFGTVLLPLTVIAVASTVVGAVVTAVAYHVLQLLL